MHRQPTLKAGEGIGLIRPAGALLDVRGTDGSEMPRRPATFGTDTPGGELRSRGAAVAATSARAGYFPSRRTLLQWVGHSQKSALELIDVISVLCCAGFAWGVENLTAAHLITLRRQFEEFDSSLRLGDLDAATTLAVGFSATVIQASGNQELQTLIDLISTRSLRVLTLTAESRAWDIWRTGYRDMLHLLEVREKAAALERYRQIFVDYRACVEAMLFATV
jgi:DNA-binding FadR family transcriptional regulator